MYAFLYKLKYYGVHLVGIHYPTRDCLDKYDDSDMRIYKYFDRLYTVTPP